MTVDDPALPRPVRLVILTDWDVGFQLTPRADPPPNVSPGGECVVDCVPQESVLIQEILVRDFALVQVLTATLSIPATRARGSNVERGSLPRTYRLVAPITVQSGECVTVRLRNDGPVALKQKVPTFVRVHAAAQRRVP